MLKLLHEIFGTTSEEQLCNLCDRSSIWSRDLHAIEKLLESHWDLNLNYRDDLGMSALHYAISNKYHKAVELLLQYGASPKLADKNGLSPLGYAFKLHYQGDTEDSRLIVLQLIRAGILANIMTVKMLISYYQYDDEILTALFSPERTKKGLNIGHMLDVRILMKSLRQQNISKQTIKLLFSFKPNLGTVSENSANVGKEEIYKVEENQYQKTLKNTKQDAPASAQEIINAIAEHHKATNQPKTAKRL